MLCRCGVTIPPQRLQAGFETCIKCGDVDAQREIASKRTRTGAVYNKGPSQYLGNPEEATQTLLEGGGRKHIPIQHGYTRIHGAGGKHHLALATQPSLKKGRVVGIAYTREGDRRYVFESELDTNGKFRGRSFVPLPLP